MTPVRARIDCPDCAGSGEIVTGQAWSDGMLFTEPCRACCGTGVVPNEDFDPNEPGWYCGCVRNLAVYAGFTCGGCGQTAPSALAVAA